MAPAAGPEGGLEQSCQAAWEEDQGGLNRSAAGRKCHRAGRGEAQGAPVGVGLVPGPSALSERIC